MVLFTGLDVAVPFLRQINGQVKSAKKFTVKGIPVGRESFSIDLLCGDSEGSDIALIIEVRTNAKGDRKRVVLNARKNGIWGQEETFQHGTFPFVLNTPFVIDISATNDKFKIYVNDDHYADFEYRILPITRVTHVGVSGETQVALTEVNI